MAKFTPDLLQASYGSISKLNNNFDEIATAIENTLSRDGTSPNSMEANLDLNHHKVENLADGTNNADAVNVGQVNAIVHSHVQDAINILIAAQGDLSAFLPETYGAEGDGVTDDSAALKLMFEAVGAAGGGNVWFRPGATYRVGGQTAGGNAPAIGGGGVMRYAPTVPFPMEITGCTKAVRVFMNGAVIKCLDGKRYGTFNADGTDYVGQISDINYAATPYWAMIYIHNNSGDVWVEGGELDGNISAQNVGGGYDVTGIQLPYTGVFIGEGNTGTVLVNVHSHHHGCDGITGSGTGDPNVFENIRIAGRYNHNGRQGFSCVGAVGWFIEDGTEFVGNGKDLGGMTYSLPGAGIDFEAEGGKWVKDITIGRVLISDNAGIGAVVPFAPNVEGITFNDSILIGTTNHCFWGAGRRIKFVGGTLMGSSIHLYSDPTDITQSVNFKGTKFVYDPALSPTGLLYPDTLAAAKMVTHQTGTEVCVFDECYFGYLAHSSAGAAHVQIYFPNSTFRNCTFEGVSGSTNTLEPYGKFEGQNTIFKNGSVLAIPRADIAAANFKNYAGPAFDSFIYNGTRYAADGDRRTGKTILYGSKTWDPGSIANAASATTTVTVTGAAVGDIVVEKYLGVSLGGLIIDAYVSAANTVTVVLANLTGGAVDLASSTLNVTVRKA